MTIAIFCAANSNIPPLYYTRTRELCEYLAAEGHSVIFGGCDVGLMGCVAHSMHAAGGPIIGVVPRIFINNPQRPLPYLDELIPCENLSDRKDIIISRADVCIALPGGVGTLDEVFHVVAQTSVGYHQKPTILYNIDGFWNPLRLMIEQMRENGMLRDNLDQMLCFCDTLDSLSETLRKL